MTRFTKDPDALLDYEIDWTDWLATGDYIVSAMASVQSGLTLSTEAFTSVAHTIWLSGGTKNTDYRVTSRVWTNGGRRDDRSITIRVKER